MLTLFSTAEYCLIHCLLHFSDTFKTTNHPAKKAFWISDVSDDTISES